MTTRVTSKHPILFPWHRSPDSAYNQSSCESSSHIDGTELPFCFWIFSSVPQNGSYCFFTTLVKMKKCLAMIPEAVLSNESKHCFRRPCGRHIQTLFCVCCQQKLLNQQRHPVPQVVLLTKLSLKFLIFQLPFFLRLSWILYSLFLSYIDHFLYLFFKYKN